MLYSGVTADQGCRLMFVQWKQRYLFFPLIILRSNLSLVLVQAYGLKEILTVGTVVAGTNLQWRYDSRNRLPTVTANELSVFTVKPRQAYQNTAIHRLHAHLKVSSP